VQQIRLLTPGGYQLHQKGDDGEFRITDEGTTSLSEIPFSVAYSNRVSYLESRPPLEDIAELNLKQYQVQSDLDNQLHISAVPMLAFFGFPSAAEEVSAGPGEAIAFPAEGRAEYIEPGGTALTISSAGWSNRITDQRAWPISSARPEAKRRNCRSQAH
jgi:hypothetical protein